MKQPGDSTRGNGHKLEHGELPLHVRKGFLKNKSSQMLTRLEENKKRWWRL